MKTKGKFQLWWQMFDQIPLEILKHKHKLQVLWQNKTRICEKWLLVISKFAFQKNVIKPQFSDFLCDWELFLEISTFFTWFYSLTYILWKNNNRPYEVHIF